MINPSPIFHICQILLRTKGPVTWQVGLGGWAMYRKLQVVFTPENEHDIEKFPCSIGNTSSNGWIFHCHISFFGGVYNIGDDPAIGILIDITQPSTACNPMCQVRGGDDSRRLRASLLKISEAEICWGSWIIGWHIYSISRIWWKFNPSIHPSFGIPKKNKIWFVGSSQPLRCDLECFHPHPWYLGKIQITPEA